MLPDTIQDKRSGQMQFISGRFFLLLVMICFGMVGFSGLVHADYILWEDEKTGVSLSFPDNWELGNNRKAGDVVTLLAPGDYKDRPVCRLNVRKDGRFQVFPPRLYPAIQEIAYSREFWEKAVLAYYPEPKVVQFGDNSGLGRAFGSYVLVDYRGDISQNPPQDEAENPLEKRALSLIGIYGPDLYLFECSADKKGFDKWRPLFQSIAGSVELSPIFSSRPQGFYRDFLTE